MELLTLIWLFIRLLFQKKKRHDLINGVECSLYLLICLPAGSLCYSNEILSYSIKCKQWKKMTTGISWFPRYGASSCLVEDSIYTIGGFNGQLLSDLVVFKPDQSSESVCSISREEDTCSANKLKFDLLENNSQSLYCSYCTYPNMKSDDDCQFCYNNAAKDGICLRDDQQKISPKNGKCSNDVRNGP